jgi:hypothetical protein
MKLLRVLLLSAALSMSACSDDSPAPAGGTPDSGQDSSNDTAQGGDGDVAPDLPGDTSDPDGAVDDVADDAPRDDAADAPVDATDVSEDAPDTGEPDVPAVGCTGPDSCQDGEVCSGALGCAMAWECVERTCDADDPAVLLCGCDGVTFTAQLSCIGRPAAYTIDQVSPVPNGVMCDPLVEGPVYFDVVVTGQGFEAYEGLDVHLRVQDTSRGEVVGFGTVTVVNGGFSVRFDDVFDPDLFGVILEYYVDVNGNGSCDADTDAGFTEFVNNPFDWEGQEAPVTVTAEREFEELCDQW